VQQPTSSNVLNLAVCKRGASPILPSCVGTSASRFPNNPSWYRSCATARAMHPTYYCKPQNLLTRHGEPSPGHVNSQSTGPNAQPHAH